MYLAKKHPFLFAAILLIGASWLGPVLQLSQFQMMPGNIGDARLNNYFLENIYQYVFGHAPSLTHLSFFYPFPYVLGFSDNLFGSSPVYLLARALTQQPETAFQLWYFFGFVVNFAACYSALRRLDVGSIGSAFGALIFAFALPVAGHAGHAQLHYRFGVPLSLAAFVFFLRDKNWKYLLISFAWLVWQFYCSIYIGFFLGVMLIATLFSYGITSLLDKRQGVKSRVSEFKSAWLGEPARYRRNLLLAFVVLLALMAALFFPYMQVSSLYGAKRSYDEIATMLPRISSYFFADSNKIWPWHASAFSDIPMPHEHRMFVGVLPMSLAVIGFLIGRRATATKQTGALLGGALLLTVASTLSVGGYSLWYFFSKLPLASAIRVVTRFDVVFLFPVAFFAAIAIDRLAEDKRTALRIGGWLLFVALIFEFGTGMPMISEKKVWQDRREAAVRAVPSKLPTDAILFFAQKNEPPFAEELDAMWAGLSRGVPTLNGYSGGLPPGYSYLYSDDCAELPRRIAAFLKFSGKSNDGAAYRAFMKRVVPIRFEGCRLAPDYGDLPTLSEIDRAYKPEEFKPLSFEYLSSEKRGVGLIVTLRVLNSSNQKIAAISTIGKPINFSWQFADPAGLPLAGWDPRKPLALDIPANGSLDVRLNIEKIPTEPVSTLSVSVVQDGVFWGHDVGVKPLRIDLAAVRAIPFKQSDGAASNPQERQTVTLGTPRTQPIAASQFKTVSLKYQSQTRSDGQNLVNVVVNNGTNVELSGAAGEANPIRLSWRFIGTDGAPLSGWDARFNVAPSVASGKSATFSLPVILPQDRPVSALEVSIVQEGVFWAHDLGVKPLSIKWSK